MTGLLAILSAGPDEAGWLDICRRAEDLSDGEVAEVARRLQEWPDDVRHMPDRWWAQRQAGDHRPWHKLATHRRLCQLGEYFPVSVAACPDDLSLVLAAAGATSNSDLGYVTLMRPATETGTTDPVDDEAENGLLAATLVEQAEAIDGQFSPDGSQVILGLPTLAGRAGHSSTTVTAGCGSASFRATMIPRIPVFWRTSILSGSARAVTDGSLPEEARTEG